MDISVFVLEKIFGKDPQTIARIFLLRMWSGYCFDVGEITFLSLYVGINYKSDTWRYVFYGYCGFLGLVAMLLTITFIQCIIGKDSRRYNIVPYIMTYFKIDICNQCWICIFPPVVFWESWWCCGCINGVYRNRYRTWHILFKQDNSFIVLLQILVHIGIL